jgi:hypothetical protein
MARFLFIGTAPRNRTAKAAERTARATEAMARQSGALPQRKLVNPFPVANPIKAAKRNQAKHNAMRQAALAARRGESA